MNDDGEAKWELVLSELGRLAQNVSEMGDKQDDLHRNVIQMRKDMVIADAGYFDVLNLRVEKDIEAIRTRVRAVEVRQAEQEGRDRRADRALFSVVVIALILLLLGICVATNIALFRFAITGPIPILIEPTTTEVPVPQSTLPDLEQRLVGLGYFAHYRIHILRLALSRNLPKQALDLALAHLGNDLSNQLQSIAHEIHLAYLQEYHNGTTALHRPPEQDPR